MTISAPRRMQERGTSYRAIVPFIIQDKAAGTRGTDTAFARPTRSNVIGAKHLSTMSKSDSLGGGVCAGGSRRSVIRGAE